MKRSKLQDFQRAVEKRDKAKAPSISSFSFSGVPGFSDTAVEPNSGFIAICGGTGIGKTAILDLIYCALAPQSQIRSTLRRARLAESEVKIKVLYPNGEYESIAHPSESPQDTPLENFPHGVYFVDLLDRTLSNQAFFAASDIGVLKEGVSPSSFEDDDIKLISAVCKRDYDFINIFEIEEKSDIVRPFFEIKSGNSEYDSRSMATGELSALYIAWILKYCGPYSIVLIEEPESYLPPLSHLTIYSLICRATVKKNLCVIFTTHSALVAGKVPDNSLISIRRHSNLSTLPSTKESKLRVLSRLGLRPTNMVIALVEDKLASDVLSEILEIYDFGIHSYIQIVIVDDGIGGIKKAIENMPSKINNIHLIGILDGDAKNEAADWKCLDKVLFLPFRRVMEEEFVQLVEKEPLKFSRKVNRKLQRVEDAIEEHKGQDYHEKFKGLSESVGISIESMTRIALQQWISTHKRKPSIKKFIRNLSRLIGVDIPEME